MGFFHWLFSGEGFLPHEYCYRRDPAMVALHMWSDLAIGLAYVAISLTLIYMVRRARREIPFDWIFLAFGMFIIACGGTHLMEVWTLWTPLYWLSGGIKTITAAASVVTALVLPPLVPKTVAMVRAAKLSDKRKQELEDEVGRRRQAEEELRRLAETLEERVRERTAELARVADELAEKAAIVEHSQDAVYSETLDGTITSWNPAAARIYGYAKEEIVGKNIDLLVPPDRSAELRAAIARVSRGDGIEPFETERVRKDGTRIDIQLTLSPVRDQRGAIRGAAVIARDISERKRAEQQLQEVQKLESLGLIAGGVAHDFNNLLVGILGNASLVLDTIPPSSPNYAMLENVVKASEKAAHLTQQMLAYAGKNRMAIEKIDLSRLAREISGLVQTSIPKTAQVRLELDEHLPAIEGDPGQLQQVIMNLVINGAEAIGNTPGTVLVTTERQTIDESYIRNNFAGERLNPGVYVSLEVHDTGSGMDAAVRARIFDPFFTTKFTGRGLGLSAVLGIVRSHKGTIRVYSEPGKGSTFKILLPAVEGAPRAPKARELDEQLRGEGLILVVDDEEVVRTAATAALQRYGYRTMTAENGAVAVELLRDLGREIDLVLLDMTMPVMGGEEAFRRIREMQPDTRVVISSGYNELEAVRRFTAKGITAFIQKPYTAAALARVVKGAIRNKPQG